MNIERLSKATLIRQIYSTTGACRLHCIGFAPNKNTLDFHVNHLFRSTKGILKVNCNMLLHTLKDVDGGVEYVRYQESEHLETE